MKRRHATMTSGRMVRAAMLLAACLAPGTIVAKAQDVSPLPGGASSLQETFQDWRVACQVVEAKKLCAISQQQMQQNGQRVLAIELQAGPDGGGRGSLILPFGLLLDAGVALRIDDASAPPPARFRTCLPGGCIVPLTLDAAIMRGMRAGAVLTITGKASDTGQDVVFSASLKGFAAAMDRLEALLKS